jgi:hypothetical protein
MKKLIVNLVCKIKGKSREQMDIEYLFYYFVTRSKTKAGIMLLKF